jgi:AcrR family transcriptional regulator
VPGSLTVADTATRPNVREQILDTALQLMSEHGAAGMSMRKLANACGVQVAAIYHYFDSKDALVAAVVAERQYGSRLADALPVDPDANLETRIQQLFVAVWEGALEEESIWRVLLGEGLRGEPAVLPVGRSLLELLEPAFADWVRRWLPEVAQPDAVGEIMVAQLLGGFVRHTFQPELDTGLIGREAAATLAAVVAAQPEA